MTQIQSKCKTKPITCFQNRNGKMCLEKQCYIWSNVTVFRDTAIKLPLENWGVS